jgi:preprotein translocase subunit SecA
MDIKDESKELPAPEEIISTLNSQAIESLAAKEALVGKDIFRQTERSLLLMTVDTKWMDHIDAMDQLQTSIRMRSVGQHDPVVEYKMEGGEMFDEMNDAIQNDSVKLLMRGRFELRKPNGETAGNGAADGAQNADNGMASPLAAAAARATASQKAIPTQAQQVQGAAQSNQTLEPVKRDKNKVGRNDLCPCGSGKKYKNCCGKKG